MKGFKKISTEEIHQHAISYAIATRSADNRNNFILCLFKNIPIELSDINDWF